MFIFVSLGKIQKEKRGIKTPYILDHRGTIPSFLVVTDAKQHDVKVAKNLFLPLSLDSIIAIDKAYIDFGWLYSLSQDKVYFVTRAKENLQYRVIGQQQVNTRQGIIKNEEIILAEYYTQQKYPEKLRLVTYYDKQHNKTYQFLTNNFHLAAYTISQIYKARWEIELFFKWVKQNLKIKTFLGTTKMPC